VQPSLNVQNVPWSRFLDVEHLSEPKRLRYFKLFFQRTVSKKNNPTQTYKMYLGADLKMLKAFRNQNVCAISNLLTENCLKLVQPILNVQNVPWSRSQYVEHLSEPKRLRTKESTTSDEEVREHRTAAEKTDFLKIVITINFRFNKQMKRVVSFKAKTFNEETRKL
jgi:hypothetical protein